MEQMNENKQFSRNFLTDSHDVLKSEGKFELKSERLFRFVYTVTH